MYRHCYNNDHSCVQNPYIHNLECPVLKSGSGRSARKDVQDTLIWDGCLWTATSRHADNHWLFSTESFL